MGLRGRARNVIESADERGKKQLDEVMTTPGEDKRPPPPGAGAVKRRQSMPAELFQAGTPHGDALRQHQKAPLLNPYAGPRRPRTRSPPRADLRPQAVREKSAENRGNPESYGQMREKALQQRSKVIPPGPQHFYIGADQGVKRPRPAGNQAALDRRTAPRAPGVKRKAEGAAEDRRVRSRGGAADPTRPERVERVARKAKVPSTRRKAKDSRPASSYLYNTADGVKSSRPKAESKRAKKMASPPVKAQKEAAVFRSARRAVRQVA